MFVSRRLLAKLICQSEGGKRSFTRAALFSPPDIFGAFSVCRFRCNEDVLPITFFFQRSGVDPLALVGFISAIYGFFHERSEACVSDTIFVITIPRV